MKLDKRMEALLKDAHIDFTVFRLVEAVPTAGGAVVLLAPKDHAVHTYFNRQYRDNSHWFTSMESMLDSSVESEMFTRKTADKILRDYYNSKKEGE